MLPNTLAKMLLGVTLAGMAGLSAAADDTWPSRQVSIVVPFAAGGGVDNVARVVAAQLAQELMQTVIVENRAGAGGLVGAKHVAEAQADGYTLLMGTQTTLAVAPLLHPDSGLDPLTAFAGVGKIGSSPLLLVANPEFPVRTVKELVDLAKKEPGKIDYGSGGVGTTPHMAMALLSLDTGIDMTHVPYKGEQPALTDVMGNQISLMFSNLPVALPLAKSGKLRPIAVSSPQRSPAAPHIPTVAESGVPGFEAGTWFAIVAPADTPKDVIEELNDKIGKALREPKVRDTLQGQGMTVQTDTPQQLDDYMDSEYEKWARVVKEAKIKVQ